jgi:hypothetical protein
MQVFLLVALLSATVWPQVEVFEMVVIQDGIFLQAVSIASWNVQIFGETKSSRAPVMDVIAKSIVQYLYEF